MTILYVAFAFIVATFLWAIFINMLPNPLRKPKYKGVMREVCCNCRADLYSIIEYGISYYKYCPKCGLENNVGLEKKDKNTFFTKKMALLIGCMVIVWRLVENYFQKHTISIQLLKTSIIGIGGLLVIYSILLLVYKVCPHCGNRECKRGHQHCYNCGKQL